MKSLLWNFFFFITKIGVYVPPFPTLIWILLTYRFRAYARNVVYNYVLQHELNGLDGRKKWLGRLWERLPVKTIASLDTKRGWILQGHLVHPIKRFGFLEYRKVSKLEFYLVVWLIWGWLDDDSNQDTTDIPHCDQVAHDWKQWWKPWILIAVPFIRNLPKDIVYGNSFDLGDVRGKHPYFNFWATWVWNFRNTAMNFKYLFLDY